ncbi:hypothetical protein [Advenella mimigardefordensis]|uniref:Phage protein n=1 Tax=Advenella mimigardefordensis (strain DSM 17166 / LMG 22922 / DPN7) TaxID=1247726 RepID=W0P8W5_ADVMD|nr:hypothetical protein [Advenella mimigardefordensis]AHG63161.1 hypothetical protein MIM_c10630 [Advenella mimigardefordensis DPN7]
MKNLKYRHLYDENGLLKKEPVPTITPMELDQWLRENVTDPEIRKWYRQKLAESVVVPDEEQE